MNTIKTVLITGLASLAVAAVPLATASPEQLTSVALAEKDDADKLEGIVKEVTDKKLTLKESAGDSKETEVKLTPETKYVKAGQPAKAGDVKAGVRVSIKTEQGATGLPEAVEVTILPNAQDPSPGPAPAPEPPTS